MNLRTEPSSGSRPLKTTRLACDFAIVGGGLAGTCCAITAARAGLKVVLIQDRPVLGGNASSEVRLWILGATSHMGNNNRWAREGGVVDEILVENMYRNPEGNPLILDTILLEKVVSEPNITLLLNTAVHDLAKSDADTIQSLRAFCPQNSTAYEVTAPLFCDASGDGIVGFLAGAAFRIGAEAKSEFGELWAPEQPSHDLLGHSLYFYSQDTGRPVQFIPPSYALKDITHLPRWRDVSVHDSGCRLWWLEWGGQLDTIHDTERIKWELWKVAYGVWHHIKNSGQFPEAATMTLEWVGTIPGKRESRRFEGDTMLTQHDIVEQRRHADAVSFGGWAMDLHPAEGVFSAQPGCTQWHSKGVYQIPYRCLYSRNITNLFLAGRIVSASHIAFGSSRVMATCAHGAQAVAVAAALCIRHRLKPRDLLAAPSARSADFQSAVSPIFNRQGVDTSGSANQIESPAGWKPAIQQIGNLRYGNSSRIAELQRELLRSGQFIPGVALNDPEDLAKLATISASSELRLASLRDDGTTLPLAQSWAMMLPVNPGPMPRVRLTLDVALHTDLRAELRVSSHPDNHTPNVTVATLTLPLAAGPGQRVDLSFDTTLDAPRYAFVCLLKNDAVSVHLSDQRVTGVLAVCHNGNKAVAKSCTQTPPPDIGIESFEFWTPHRRPAGKNFALTLDPPLAFFGTANLVNGLARPTRHPNAWLADWADTCPTLRLNWPTPQRIARLELAFDTDFDHPMESVLMGHPERVMPFCVRQFEIRDSAGRVLFHCDDNHQSRRTVRFESPVTTDQLTLTLTAPGAPVPAALFEVRCYA